MNTLYLHPRDQIVATMNRIYDHNMTTTSGGNISIRDDNGETWITPARVDKGGLRPADIVLITPSGEIEGAHPPSSEWPFHQEIYSQRPDLRAIIHAHPNALVSFSICGQVPCTRSIPEAWNLCGEVALAPYAVPGSRELGRLIAEQFAKQPHHNEVILENHGVVVGAQDLPTAFARFESLEHTAQTTLDALRLGSVHALDQEQLFLATRAKEPLPEYEALSPSSRERELRKEICDFVRRAYRHRLMTSAWGSFSARIDHESFLVTPYPVDRHELDLSQLVVIRNGCRPMGTTPSRVATLHAAIYRRHNSVNAIVNALPTSATAFSITRAPLETRTIPESYLFLRDLVRVPFEQLYTDVEEVAAMIGPDRPVALLENNGALVAGRTVLDAFDRLEVLEATAAALIRTRSLGSVKPMADNVIEELLAAFPS